jgi:Sap, sulfolipid-1-addressing protein
VTSAAFTLIPYALIAAASPLGLAATLTVLRTGRVQALGLAVGVLVGQLLACSVLVLIGAASINHRTKRPNVEGVLEVVLGLALVAVALRVRRLPLRTEHNRGRSRQILDRLQRVGLKADLVAGLALGVGGPKRLVLTALAAASITAAGLDGEKEAALVLWYTAIATIVVWGPVLLALVLRDRAVDMLDSGVRWLTRHQRGVSVLVLLVVGAYFVTRGLVLLLTQS